MINILSLVCVKGGSVSVVVVNKNVPEVGCTGLSMGDPTTTSKTALPA